jgi:hypothetical protein
VFAIASNEDLPCDDQIAALQQEVFGATSPTDPEVLRELVAEYEAKFATICSPLTDGSGVTVELTEEDRAPYIPETGIFEATESILPIYDFSTYWVGRTGPGETEFVWVYAGVLTADPKTGGVVVMPYGAGPGPFIPTPVSAGPVQIVKADDTALTLTVQAMDGSAFTFDVAKGVFV